MSVLVSESLLAPQSATCCVHPIKCDKNQILNHRLHILIQIHHADSIVDGYDVSKIKQSAAIYARGSSYLSVKNCAFYNITVNPGSANDPPGTVIHMGSFSGMKSSVARLENCTFVDVGEYNVSKGLKSEVYSDNLMGIYSIQTMEAVPSVDLELMPDKVGKNFLTLEDSWWLETKKVRYGARNRQG
jgi:hypothetical protein